MKNAVLIGVLFGTAVGVATIASTVHAQVPGAGRAAIGPNAVITNADCSAERVGAPIPASAIGEPVGAITLAVRWVDAAGAVPSHCRVDGVIAPANPMPTARPINFSVLLPASWNHRGMQMGGGGMNGFVPNLAGDIPGGAGEPPLQRGFATYGSDSGHQLPPFGRGRGGPGGPPGRPGGPPPPAAPIAPGPPAGAANTNPDWALNDEAIKNLGYMQMKKTHDVAMVLMERLYRERPRFNYFVGTSQGGREALTVAQRYPADYDGIVANVPILNFSSLMLAPEWIRIQEKPLANWVTPAKVNVIRGEFMRQADALDGLADGVINNYMAARALFDVSQGTPGRNPWAARRCPNNVDPNPADDSAAACLTDGQIATLKMVYSPYKFAAPLVNGVSSFGMWTPNTDPSGSGLILGARFLGQEGAPADAAPHTHLGILGVTGFVMKDLAANPLDVAGDAYRRRWLEISAWLDATNPDLSAFARRGGKLIVTIGTNDTLASPGAQLAYFQAVIDRMGRPGVDAFARFFVLPQASHGMSGTAYTTSGDGNAVVSTPLPNSYNRLPVLMDWVENNTAPATSLTVTAGDRSLPLCSYPTYPRYVSGPVERAQSYTCADAPR